MKKDEAIELLSENRFYVFFGNGTWRVATPDQWRLEQIYKQDVKRCCWLGGPDLQELLQKILEPDNSLTDEEIERVATAVERLDNTMMSQDKLAKHIRGLKKDGQ
jgi:hypothetical protein